MFDPRNRLICPNELYDIYFARKQRAKCGPTADRLSCRISTKMDSQPCGGTIPNKPPQCVYSQLELTTILELVELAVDIVEVGERHNTYGLQMVGFSPDTLSF